MAKMLFGVLFYSLFRGTFHFSRSVAHFPEVLLTFSKINKVRYFYQTFLFQIFNYTNLILNQLLYNSILSIFNICILSTSYNKCALKSSSLISVKYAGAISNTVLQPSDLHHKDVLQLLHKRLIHLL